jgi:uncharacterized FlaG/YvyC family protein
VNLEEWNSLVKTVQQLKKKLDQIPIPFKFMYKPPSREEYVNIVEFLDELDKRLKRLEENA